MAGVLTTAFEENKRLADFFKVLSLSLDKKGLPYISTMEAHKVIDVHCRAGCNARGWHPSQQVHR
jgi:hypothetical protein